MKTRLPFTRRLYLSHVTASVRPSEVDRAVPAQPARAESTIKGLISRTSRLQSDSSTTYNAQATQSSKLQRRDYRSFKQTTTIACLIPAKLTLPAARPMAGILGTRPGYIQGRPQDILNPSNHEARGQTGWTDGGVDQLGESLYHSG